MSERPKCPSCGFPLPTEDDAERLAKEIDRLIDVLTGWSETTDDHAGNIMTLEQVKANIKLLRENTEALLNTKRVLELLNRRITAQMDR